MTNSYTSGKRTFECLGYHHITGLESGKAFLSHLKRSEKAGQVQLINARKGVSQVLEFIRGPLILML